MTTLVQKQREIAYATKAGELLNECWEVEASLDEVSWPDLIVNTESRTFGLEVREIYRDEARYGSTKKAREIANLKLVRNLAKSYYETSRVPIKVDLLGSIDRHEQLLDMIAKEAGQLSVFGQSRLEPNGGCVVYIRRLPEQFSEYSRWGYVSDQVGWVGTIDKACLERVIAKKARNLTKYTKQISDVRLLIVSDRIYNSGKERLQSVIKCDSHGFSAVYYLSYPEAAWRITS